MVVNTGLTLKSKSKIKYFLLQLFVSKQRFDSKFKIKYFLLQLFSNTGLTLNSKVKIKYFFCFNCSTLGRACRPEHRHRLRPQLRLRHQSGERFRAQTFHSHGRIRNRHFQVSFSREINPDKSG
jgi:hypothetical protein